MSRRRKDPLRPLTDDERRYLTRLRRSTTSPAVHVAQATMLLAVADGADYRSAAHAAGRVSGDAVSHLVARFNREGLVALDPRHGGGHVPTYGGPTRDRILREAARPPTPADDGTAIWSLTAILAELPAPTSPATGSRAAWERWQAGLAWPITLPEQPPPLRMLLVLDNLAGHRTAAGSSTARAVTRLWRKWLSRRSWAGRLTWDQFNEVRERFPLPRPVLTHSVFRFAANR